MKSIKRDDLKEYFQTNKIPTQDHFVDLIDGMLSSDDGIEKSADTPLKITADKINQQGVLNLYRFGETTAPSWSLRLRDGSDEKCLVIEGKDKGQEVRIKGNLYIEGNIQVDGDAAKRKGGKANWDSGPSDERLKDFKELNGSLEKMRLLRGVSYKWKSETPDKLEHFGLIAQDLQKVEELKDWVTERDGYFCIEPSDGALQLYALTVEAVKELDRKISSITLADGTIKAAGRQGLLFAAADGAAEAAWLGCSVQGANYSLEMRAAGGIELNAANSALVLQKRGGGTVVGGPLTAQGNIATSGSLAASGAIQPSAGNSESNGIMFPKNPGGGSGDAAWIRYYPIFREKTVLEIGTSNDASDHIVLNASGNIGIGIINPEFKLDVQGAISARNSDIYFTNIDHDHTGIGNTAGYAAIENARNYDALMILGRAGTPEGRKVRLWDYLEVCGTLKTDKFKIGDKWLLSGIGDAHGNDDWLRLFGVDGSGYYGGFAAGKFWTVTGNYFSESDIRKKKNVCELKDSLEKIAALKGVQFEWKDSGNELGVQFGLIAQDAEHVFPELVKDGPDGMKGINYSGLIAPLIEAVKEQQMQINSLSEKVSRLDRAE